MASKAASPDLGVSQGEKLISVDLYGFKFDPAWSQFQLDGRICAALEDLASPAKHLCAFVKGAESAVVVTPSSGKGRTMAMAIICFDAALRAKSTATSTVRSSQDSAGPKQQGQISPAVLVVVPNDQQANQTLSMLFRLIHKGKIPVKAASYTELSFVLQQGFPDNYDPIDIAICTPARVFDMVVGSKLDPDGINTVVWAEAGQMIVLAPAPSKSLYHASDIGRLLEQMRGWSHTRSVLISSQGLSTMLHKIKVEHLGSGTMERPSKLSMPAVAHPYDRDVYGTPSEEMNEMMAFVALSDDRWKVTVQLQAGSCGIVIRRSSENCIEMPLDSFRHPQIQRSANRPIEVSERAERVANILAQDSEVQGEGVMSALSEDLSDMRIIPIQGAYVLDPLHSIDGLLINRRICIPVPKTPKTLLDLPAEVRNHIYGYIIPMDQSIGFVTTHVDNNKIFLRSAQKQDKSLSLCLVNKQISSETLPIFYSTNTFTFDRITTLIIFLRTAGSNCKLLRRIDITANHAFVLSSYGSLSHLTAAGNLTSFRINHTNICSTTGNYSMAAQVSMKVFYDEVKDFVRQRHAARSAADNLGTGSVLDVISIIADAKHSCGRPSRSGERCRGPLSDCGIGSCNPKIDEHVRELNDKFRKMVAADLQLLEELWSWHSWNGGARREEIQD